MPVHHLLTPSLPSRLQRVDSSTTDTDRAGSRSHTRAGTSQGAPVDMTKHPLSCDTAPSGSASHARSSRARARSRHKARQCWQHAPNGGVWAQNTNSIYLTRGDRRRRVRRRSPLPPPPHRPSSCECAITAAGPHEESVRSCLRRKWEEQTENIGRPDQPPQSWPRREAAGTGKRLEEGGQEPRRYTQHNPANGRLVESGDAAAAAAAPSCHPCDAKLPATKAHIRLEALPLHQQSAV